MPFALAIVGLVLVISGVRDTTGNLVTLVKGDFTGDNNFIYWFIAILIVGGAGYVSDLRGLSRAFLALLLVVLFLSENKTNGNGGFFSQFTSSISQITGAKNNGQ